MDEKQYANIMEAIAMNANDREYNRLEYLMRELLELSFEECCHVVGCEGECQE